MNSKQLSEICIAALEDASVSRGARQGMLKKTCPKSGTDAAAAWQAMTLQSDPCKAGVLTIAMFSERQMAIFDAVGKAMPGYRRL